MNAAVRFLVIGGYGTFGGKIVSLLRDEQRLTLIVAGRSLEKAQRFCLSQGKTRAKLLPHEFDRQGDLAAQLATLHPDILVDASGPFQNYGDDRYALIEACIAERVNYLDLADGSDFVAGVAAYDARARAAGLYVLSGVSSFPVLTAAVVRKLSVGMTSFESIRAGIAPSPYAGVGQNVIRAIAAYSGQAIQVVRDGRAATGYAMTEQMRFTVGPPGRVPLPNVLFSLVDVPDLRVLPKLWPDAKDIWMGAGPVPEILHRLLIALTWLVRLKIIPKLSPLAPLMHSVMNHLRWGEHRGGMFVEIAGKDTSGTPRTRSWHLLAEGDDGPFIPSMAVVAIVRKALEGHSPVAGARAAPTELELEDYDALFRNRAIHTGIRDETSAKKPLYARLLGSAWEQLPPEIREMHDVNDKVSASGLANVECGNNPLAKFAAWMMRFPKASAQIPVTVRFDPTAGGEIWTRNFGGETFSSRQNAGHGKSKYLLCESFGPLTFAIAFAIENESLHLILRRWSAFGIPLPMWLCPRSRAYEFVSDGKFHFHVELCHPITGLIVRYRGALTRNGVYPNAMSASSSA
jgi:hypothetical protein